MKSNLASRPLEASLLVLFDQIYRLRNVTRAAEHLGLSQPTVSVWLGKLRKQFDDPLFVRTAGGMQPTPRADALIEPTREALKLLHELAESADAFDPRTARRTFRIAMTDASHITLLPRLLAHVRHVAPLVGLEVAPITATTGQALESGAVDLALGFLAGLETGFHEQALYQQDFVCLVARKHPRVKRVFSLEAFIAEEHVAVLSSASYPVLNAALAEQGIVRRTVLELPGFLGLAAVISTTDLIATVPRTIGETLAAAGGIRVFRCPLQIAPFEVKQYWHARCQHDAGHRWLRSVCVQLFRRKHGSGASSRE